MYRNLRSNIEEILLSSSITLRAWQFCHFYGDGDGYEDEDRDRDGDQSQERDRHRREDKDADGDEERTGTERRRVETETSGERDEDGDGTLSAEECIGAGAENLMYWTTPDDGETPQDELSQDQLFVLERTTTVQ